MPVPSTREQPDKLLPPLPGANAVLCRYGELALKRGNRGRFEKNLVQGIRRVCREQIPDVKIERIWGRILVTRPERAAFDDDQQRALRVALPKVFGLESFSLGCLVPSRIEAIGQAAEELLGPLHQAALVHRGTAAGLTFRVKARRSDKRFPLSSVELGRRIADRLLPLHPELVVDLKRAELSLYIEVREEWTIVFGDVEPGPGGLPSGTASSGLALLSGGIDSPVAAWLAMKRGCRLDFLTFHSHPYTPPESVEKVARIARVLNEYQASGRLFACNLVEAQKAIRDSCSENYRTLLYRRLMMKIAGAIARYRHLETLVTGEAIGQVSSQTVRNLGLIDDAAELLVLRPVICWDKMQIVDLARRIGTFAISQEQCPDSCTVFAPRNPETGGKLGRIGVEEGKLEIDELLRISLEQTLWIDPRTGAEQPWQEP